MGFGFSAANWLLGGVLLPYAVSQGVNGGRWITFGFGTSCVGGLAATWWLRTMAGQQALAGAFNLGAGLCVLALAEVAVEATSRKRGVTSAPRATAA